MDNRCILKISCPKYTKKKVDGMYFFAGVNCTFNYGWCGWTLSGAAGHGWLRVPGIEHTQQHGNYPSMDDTQESDKAMCSLLTAAIMWYPYWCITSHFYYLQRYYYILISNQLTRSPPGTLRHPHTCGGQMDNSTLLYIQIKIIQIYNNEYRRIIILLYQQFLYFIDLHLDYDLTRTKGNNLLTLDPDRLITINPFQHMMSFNPLMTSRGTQHLASGHYVPT